MTASSRGSQAAVSLIKSSRHPRICSNCISSISRPSRQYGTAAAEPKLASDASNMTHIPPVTTSNTSSSPYLVKSGILLSRAPLITRPISSFEKAFYFYQKRLNERLAMPFTRYFYHKKDTPADVDWKRKAKDRNMAAARELGGYQAYGKFGWNDELLVGDNIIEPSATVDTLTKDAVMSVDEQAGGHAKEIVKEELEGAVEKPLKRYTEADEKNDTKSLDRKLARTLYLCVQKEKSGWGLPSGTLIGRENLHQAAERILVQTAGLNMNTWIVGHVPVGHHVRNPRLTSEGAVERQGEKTFFMKGRIMAGQANLKDNLFGLSDFKWLTKQEVEKHVSPSYFSQVKNMMSER